MAPSPQNAHDLLIRDEERLRALARGILRDPQAADDVVQDAWLVTTAKPRRLGNPQAWLRTVTRNLALRRIRSTGRRRSRERHAARSESLPSTLDRVEAIELRRRLLDAVESLEEPYRSTIVWRYLDDLAPSTIAREYDIPVKTVKTRLARGLKQLRRRLDRTHGDRRAWALPLGTLAWPERAAASASAAELLAVGGLTMAAKTVTVAAALAVIALGAWVVLDRQQDARDPTQAPDATADAPAAADATLHVRDATSTAHAESGTASVAPAAAAGGAGGTFLVSGIVRFDDAARGPVAGLEVLLHRLEKHAIQPRRLRMTTGADGSFRTPAPVPSGHVRVEVVCKGIASYRRPLVLADLELGQSESEGLALVLPWFGRATVVVLDDNQAPIVGAKVALFHADAWRHRAAKGGALTDETGTLVVERLPPEQSLVAVIRAAGYGPVRSRAFTAGTTAQGVRIVLHTAKGARVRGRVERADGSRAANVLVNVSFATPSGRVLPVPPGFVHTDADGLFEMTDVAPGSYQFRAELDGVTASTRGMLQVSAGDDIEVELRPDAHLSITGVVVDEKGRPWTADRRSEVSGNPRGPKFVSVGALQHRSGMAYPHRVALDEQGGFEVKVPVGSAFSLNASAPRLGFATSQPVEAQPGASDLRLVWRQPHVRLLVRVLDGKTGEPLKGAEVMISKSRHQRTTTTRRHGDANGTVKGPWVGGGGFQVFVFAVGHCYDQATIEIGTKETGEHEHVFRLGPGRSIRGRVEDRKGQPVVGRRVGILIPGAPGWFENSLVATDDKGAFTVEGLRPHGGRIAVYNENRDTRTQVDASGNDVVLVVKSP